MAFWWLQIDRACQRIFQNSKARIACRCHPSSSLLWQGNRYLPIVAGNFNRANAVNQGPENIGKRMGGIDQGPLFLPMPQAGKFRVPLRGLVAKGDRKVGGGRIDPVWINRFPQ